ncbi:hypothetical protein OIDMADRAFT_51785 [Oidiodendron maius Zn]|uniref:Secreted protein n=1 Tax=Oidiodendron maius (strain Zn) TaxID=913774 RepID=A0A0C3HLE1_OIDMZ|nr:hypothetical protein OIDMADRAFT_51785 [Oidiodendron maius Zn]
MHIQTTWILVLTWYARGSSINFFSNAGATGYQEWPGRRNKELSLSGNHATDRRTVMINPRIIPGDSKGPHFEASFRIHYL